MDGARTTVFDVERERRSRIWLLFATLVGVFFAGVWLLTLCIALAAAGTFFDTRVFWLTFTPAGLLALLLCSAGAAWLYWRFSRLGAQERLLEAMHAQPIDTNDRYHQRLKNIVDEIAIAGGCPHLRCVVVPTVGMNAFAFSDFSGGGTIGVTEGALARLSREQLQGVVAHEAAHVVCGDCATVTAACLLFGLYSSAVAGLAGCEASSDGARETVEIMPYALLLQGVFVVLALASALINSAISRQREYRADAAAVRYTRDPLGLAQALGMMARHPSGAGWIPSGLAALCIRPTGSSVLRLAGPSRGDPPAHRQAHRRAARAGGRQHGLVRVALVRRGGGPRATGASPPAAGDQDRRSASGRSWSWIVPGGHERDRYRERYGHVLRARPTLSGVRRDAAARRLRRRAGSCLRGLRGPTGIPASDRQDPGAA